MQAVLKAVAQLNGAGGGVDARDDALVEEVPAFDGYQIADEFVDACHSVGVGLTE